MPPSLFHNQPHTNTQNTKKTNKQTNKQLYPISCTITLTIYLTRRMSTDDNSKVNHTIHCTSFKCVYTFKYMYGNSPTDVYSLKHTHVRIFIYTFIYTYIVVCIINNRSESFLGSPSQISFWSDITVDTIVSSSSICTVGISTRVHTHTFRMDDHWKYTVLIE